MFLLYYLLNEIRITYPVFYLQMTVKDCRTGIQERKNAVAPEARGTQINATKVRQVSKTFIQRFFSPTVITSKRKWIFLLFAKAIMRVKTHVQTAWESLTNTNFDEHACTALKVMQTC